MVLELCPLCYYSVKYVVSQTHQLAVSEEYFQNTVAMNKMLIQRHLGVLRQPVNKDL